MSPDAVGKRVDRAPQCSEVEFGKLLDGNRYGSIEDMRGASIHRAGEQLDSTTRGAVEGLEHGIQRRNGSGCGRSSGVLARISARRAICAATRPERMPSSNSNVGCALS